MKDRMAESSSTTRHNRSDVSGIIPPTEQLQGRRQEASLVTPWLQRAADKITPAQSGTTPATTIVRCLLPIPSRFDEEAFGCVKQSGGVTKGIICPDEHCRKSRPTADRHCRRRARTRSPSRSWPMSIGWQGDAPSDLPRSIGSKPKRT